MMRTGLCTGVALLAITTAANAQICLGTASFREGPVRLGLNFEFPENAKTYGAEIAFGAQSGLFASANVGRIDDDELDESATTFGGLAGFGVDVSPGGTAARTLEICPFAGVNFLSGPDFDDPLLGSIETSGRSFGGGIGIGGILSSNATMSFIPSLSVSYVNEEVTLDDGTNELELSDDYGLFVLTAGFVFNRTLTIRPGISFPVGVEDADPVFGISLSFNFGRAATSG